MYDHFCLRPWHWRHSVRHIRKIEIPKLHKKANDKNWPLFRERSFLALERKKPLERGLRNKYLINQTHQHMGIAICLPQHGHRRLGQHLVAHEIGHFLCNIRI